MLTLNNLNKAFSRIADAHQQINSYGFGDPLDMAVSGTIDYPMLWVIPKDVGVRQGEVGFSFTFLFMDLVHKDESNKIEVWSDQMLTALDVLAELTNPDWPFVFVLPEATATPFEEKGDDEVAGYSVDLRIRSKYTRDRCAIPEGAVLRTFLNEPGSGSSSVTPFGSVTIYDQNGAVVTTVSPGGSYTIPCGLLGQDGNQLYAQ